MTVETRLLHLSDTHFGTEVPAVVEALVEWVRAHPPDVLVLSGDITQRARTRQFAAARAFVDRLRVPVRVVLPGNHDVPLFDLATRLLQPYGGFERAFGPTPEPWHVDPRWRVVAVKTTRRWRHVHGEVSRAQADRAARRLEGADAAQLRIVVTHQPAHVIRHQDLHTRLRGARPALYRWAQAGADLVLGGHIHLPYVAPLHEALPGLARPMWIVQAGTAVSRRVRAEAGNSVNLLRWTPPGPGAARQVVVERWDVDRDHTRFERVADHRLVLAPA